MMSTSSIDVLLEPTLVRALVSWMPPSQKLTGSKMMESPRGLPDASVAVMVSLEVGARMSSAPIPKEKSSKDIPRSLAAPDELEGSSSRVLFLDDDNGRRPSVGPRPKSIPAESRSMEKIRALPPPPLPLPDEPVSNGDGATEL